MEALTERRHVVAMRRQEQEAQRARRWPLAAPAEETQLEEEQGVAMALGSGGISSSGSGGQAGPGANASANVSASESASASGVSTSPHGASSAMMVARPGNVSAASAPIAITGAARYHVMREGTSPFADMSPSARALEQQLVTSAPALPLGSSPRSSPPLRKAAFCGNCGSPFNSESQRFCTGCGIGRTYVSPSS